MKSTLCLLLCVALAGGAPDLLPGDPRLSDPDHQHHGAHGAHGAHGTHGAHDAHGDHGDHGGQLSSSAGVDYGAGIQITVRRSGQVGHHNPFLPSYQQLAPGTHQGPPPPQTFATLSFQQRFPNQQPHSGFQQQPSFQQQSNFQQVSGFQQQPVTPRPFVPIRREDLNLNPGTGGSGPKDVVRAHCGAGLMCVVESHCDPYTGFVVGSLPRNTDPSLPTVAIQRCQIATGLGVCCQQAPRRAAAGPFQTGQYQAGGGPPRQGRPVQSVASYSENPFLGGSAGGLERFGSVAQRGGVPERTPLTVSQGQTGRTGQQVICAPQQQCVELNRCGADGYIINSAALGAIGQQLSLYCTTDFIQRGVCCLPRPQASFQSSFQSESRPDSQSSFQSVGSQSSVQSPFPPTAQSFSQPGSPIVFQSVSSQSVSQPGSQTAFHSVSGQSGSQSDSQSSFQSVSRPDSQTVFHSASAQSGSQPGTQSGVSIFDVRSSFQSSRRTPDQAVAELSAQVPQLSGQLSGQLSPPEPLLSSVLSLLTSSASSSTGSVLSPPSSAPEGCGRSDSIGISGVGLGEGDAGFGELPWQAILLYPNGTFVCGASLVGGRHVVTAAHCVIYVRPEEIRVRLGEYQLNTDSEPSFYQDTDVVKIHIHPGFRKGSLFNDVAVLELSWPAQLGTNVRPICLPQPGQLFRGQCLTSGWGQPAFDTGSQDVLKKVQVSMVESAVCQSQLKKTRLGSSFRLDDSFTCAQGEQGVDVCSLDGGGPLSCSVDGSYVLAGISSWGINCGEDTPAVFASATEALKFIQTAMGIITEDSNDNRIQRGKFPNNSISFSR